MNIFNKIVDEALENQPHLVPLKIVVEKELLHHDILRVMREYNFLEGLTFIGGTCLRACYGSTRLSEDLDFTGGANFSRKQLSALATTLTQELHSKYGLKINISEPVKDKSNVDTWKITIETRKEKKNLPTQRINIDICAVPSYEPQFMMLLNLYDVEMGTLGLILQAQSQEEIYTDKLLAFALRPNRIKHRDLWDIMWLHNKGIQPNFTLIAPKLSDRNLAMPDFLDKFRKRVISLQTDEVTLIEEFQQEMQRFITPKQLTASGQKQELWKFIIYLMGDLQHQVEKYLKN